MLLDESFFTQLNDVSSQKYKRIAALHYGERRFFCLPIQLYRICVKFLRALALESETRDTEERARRLVGRLGRTKRTQGNGEGFLAKWGKTANV